MPDYPTSLCPTIFLNLDAYTVSLMYLRIDCPLDICLFYWISKVQALEASVFFLASIDTETNMRHISKSIQRTRTFSLISLCVLHPKYHQQKCIFFPESSKVTLKTGLLQSFFYAGFCHSVSCSQKSLYGGPFYFRPFTLCFSTRKMSCLWLTKKSQMKLRFLGSIS